MKIVILFPLPIFLAVMISEVKNKGFSSFVQSMVFLPHFLSWVVITGIFKNLLAVDGPVNHFLGALGLPGDTHWFGEASLFRGLVVALSGWKEIGYSSIVYIAAIMAIDMSLYEAAKLDGAGKFQQIFRITIPMIVPTIVVMLIIRLGYLDVYKRQLLYGTRVVLSRAPRLRKRISDGGFLSRRRKRICHLLFYTDYRS